MLGHLKIAKSHWSRLFHTFKNSHAPPSQNDDTLFGYTNGRWLWNERQQQAACYRRFDVPSLQKAACQAVGAKKCVSLEKIGEGNYNKAYRLVMEDGRKRLQPWILLGLYWIYPEWGNFHVDQPCPYRFSIEQVDRHYAEAETFNKSQELWEGLRGILTDEGYTSNETFPKAVETVQELRELGLTNMTGEERDDFEHETKWVEDLAS